MGTSARFVLSAVALVQLLLLGGSTAVLILRLRGIEADVDRLGREESAFLSKLDASETDLYRLSILLRDSLTDPSHDQVVASRELASLLQQVSVAPLQPPTDASPELRKHLKNMEEARQDYAAHIRAISSWSFRERRMHATSYLARQVSPIRERFSSAVSEIASVVRTLRARRTQASSESIHQIERLTWQVLLVSAVLGLGFAFAVLSKLRQYEGERDLHLKKLVDAEEELRALSQRLLETQEDERRHLSRELHDEVGQVLTALRVQLGQIAVLGETGSEQHLRQATQLAERSLQTVRQIARGLRPAMLDDLGLGPTLKWLGRDVSNNTGLNVEVEINGELSRLEDSRRTCVYRVVQEALTNCIKHAQATRAHVAVHESPAELTLDIWDDGIGMKFGKRQGLGLLGMRERVEELGGAFRVATTAGAGMAIRVNLPKGEPEPSEEQDHDSRTHCG
jgi:signal transduction histidine kinase